VADAPELIPSDALARVYSFPAPHPGRHAKEEKMRTKPTLVLGATGKTGRRVAERLTARGLPVRLGSRSGEPPFDWDDRATWTPAVNGTGATYVTYYPDLAIPGAADTVGAFANLAVKSGVRRLVLRSGRGSRARMCQRSSSRS
jgi:uncharacterized protein YbjT (DUF2867 family)